MLEVVLIGIETGSKFEMGNDWWPGWAVDRKAEGVTDVLSVCQTRGNASEPRGMSQDRRVISLTQK